MLMWLYELIIGRKSCQHKWVIHKEGHLHNDSNKFIGMQYHLVCKNCGNMKREIFKGF